MSKKTKKPTSHKRAVSSCLNGTVHEVLSSGRGNAPYRALVVGRDYGRYLVVSDEPLKAREGDDIYLTGILQPKLVSLCRVNLK